MLVLESAILENLFPYKIVIFRNEVVIVRYTISRNQFEIMRKKLVLIVIYCDKLNYEK